MIIKTVFQNKLDAKIVKKQFRTKKRGLFVGKNE